MATFWDYFSVLAPSVGLALLFWLIMRSLLRADTGEREAEGRRRSGADARAAAEEAEAREWARGRRADEAPAQGRVEADAEAPAEEVGEAPAEEVGEGRAPEEGAPRA
ncbi:hypothetical protein M3C74_08030 [Micrococcus lylae]|uniref:hypothetical protein n=1 Tax=Micrococcus lylae TaxID=1273 RepID=UPI0021A7F4D5|nr:hypothetical protein [Micrococcus lylae]MCT2007921.1 hypothetical protein [Micrococcus lylae]MCT2071775.1 hypothetical protein [Micrococcus lylae]